MKLSGIELIAQERKEQIEKHGRTVEHDVAFNTGCQLADAARVLLLDTPCTVDDYDAAYVFEKLVPAGWDKDIWSKMIRKPYKERVIIAATLLAAEVDRLQNQPVLESNNL